jgi:hypothetical protein
MGAILLDEPGDALSEPLMFRELTEDVHGAV